MMPATRAVVEQHVVAEQVAVDRALRQPSLAEAGLEPDLRGEQRVLLRRRGTDARRAPPGATSRARAGW